MTCYKSISLKNFCGCGGIEDTYVRGAYDSNVVKVQVLSTAPFGKLMEFQNVIGSHGKQELVSTSCFTMSIFFDKPLELEVAHVVAFVAITCVSEKNNSHISLLIFKAQD